MNAFTAYCIGIISFITGGVFLILHDHPWFGGMLLLCAALTECSHNTKDTKEP